MYFSQKLQCHSKPTNALQRGSHLSQLMWIQDIPGVCPSTEMNFLDFRLKTWQTLTDSSSGSVGVSCQILIQYRVILPGQSYSTPLSMFSDSLPFTSRIGLVQVSMLHPFNFMLVRCELYSSNRIKASIYFLSRVLT